MKKKIESFEDLEVYQKLCELHLEVNELTLKFPKFELYELGSQLRRSSNSSPANLAEGWNNKHVNIYLEGINRALGELRETVHHNEQPRSKLRGINSVIPACPESFLKKDSRRALLAGMTKKKSNPDAEHRGILLIKMAHRKNYIEEKKYLNLIDRYKECGRMLKSLEISLLSWKSKNL